MSKRVGFAGIAPHDDKVEEATIIRNRDIRKEVDDKWAEREVVKAELAAAAAAVSKATALKVIRPEPRRAVAVIRPEPHRATATTRYSDVMDNRSSSSPSPPPPPPEADPSPSPPPPPPSPGR